MSKAVLVMDMPEHCCTCPLWIIDGYETDLCKFTERKIKDVFKHKPNWCPLIPDPEHYRLEKWEKDGYKGGWNDALDQIGLCDDALEGK